MIGKIFIAGLALAGSLGTGPAETESAERKKSPEPEHHRAEYVHATMGTKFHFIAYAADSQRVSEAFTEAAQRLDALNASLSDYIFSSEVSRLSSGSGQGYWRILPTDLWQVLSWGNQLAAQSQGAFDMTVGPLTRLWRISLRTGKLPSPRRLTSARASVGHEYLVLDATKQRAQLMRPGMQLDLGGIAKGYAVDEALAVLQRHGIRSALVDGGGDLRAAGSPPHSEGWTLTLQDLTETPNEPRLITNLAVATSGDLYQTVTIGEREFSHIVDAKTGLGLEFRRSVTVLAPDTMTADALASALSVLPVKESASLLRKHYPDATARIATKSGDTTEVRLIGSESRFGWFADQLK